MDSLSLKVYKSLKIKKWTAKYTKFIFLKLIIEFECNGLTILGPIGNSCLSVRRITQWFGFVHCIRSQVQI